MGSATDAVILCDQETFQEARNEVEFDPNPVMLHLKGERKQVKVYKPVRKATQMNASQRRGGRNGVSYTKEQSSNDEDDDIGFIGRQAQRNEIEEIYKKLVDESPWCGVIGVQGDSGMGKSRVLQYVARVAKKYKSTVLSGFALDTEQSTPFFTWKSIVIQLIQMVASSRNPVAGQTHGLQSVSSKETMTSYGSNQSFGSVGFGVTTPKRKTRSGSIRAPLSPPLGSQVMPMPGDGGNAYRMSSPKNSGFVAAAAGPQQPFKKFEEMNPDERKDCLLEALPLEKRELYPLLVPFVDEVIPLALLVDNETTANIVRNQRVTVAIETVVAMISYFATKLQQKGERLTIILEDLQWMDAPSLELLLQVTKNVPRHAIFCSGTFSDEQDLSKRVPCTTVWNLQRLEKHEIARCMQIWLNVSRVSESAVNMIYEKSNGNPLFSEELCRLMKDNHYFEIANDVCMLNNSGETRMNLPNSIIALMTASLDRLDASQQIVLRVVSVMGMQFTLHDLAGVLRAINKVSTAKLFDAEKSKQPIGNVKFDINEQEMTLEQMLKEGAPFGNSSTSTPNSSSLGHGGAPGAPGGSNLGGATPGSAGSERAAAIVGSNVYTTSAGHPPGPSNSNHPSALGANSSSVESNSALLNNSSGSASSVHKGSKGSSGSSDDLDELNNQGQDYTTINVNVNQVLHSLVQKGILEERAGHASSKLFAFRHAMMKETACDELLREESKIFLHEIIGSYYEERPGTDLAQWHGILAEHFFAAGDKVKARKYLELAGEGAVQSHATQQIYQCYSRLMKLAIGEEVRDLVRAQWSRKVGEALFHMERTIQAEESLHKALEILRLDCRDAPAMSGTQAGFFPKQHGAMDCFSGGATGAATNGLYQETEESVVLRSRPSSLTRFIRRKLFNTPLDEDEFAEEFEKFIQKTEFDDEAGHGIGGAGSTLSASSMSTVFTSRKTQSPPTMMAIGQAAQSPLGASLSPNGTDAGVGVPLQPQGSGGFETTSPRESAMSTVKKASSLRQASAGGSNRTIARPTRQRTMSMVEPQSPLRPRLLLEMPSFRTLRDAVMNGTETERNDAVNMLLEAALVYDLLGRMLRDRRSSVALERRLNAIILAEAAAMSFADQLVRPKKKKQKAWSWLPGSKGSKSTSSGSDNAAAAFLYSTTGDMIGSQPGGLPGSSTTNPQSISPTQQRILDELSRAYSRAAVFFSGMHPGTRWRGLGKSYAMKASAFLNTHGQVSRSDLAQHSENLVLLQQRCGEYDAIQGNFFEASEKLRYAVWGARFMHLDRVRVDSKVLELTVFFFNGDMDSCNTTACELFEKNTNPKNVALGARFMALCGVSDVAIHKLRALAKIHGSVRRQRSPRLRRGRIPCARFS
jgi:hypothetical protein